MHASAEELRFSVSESAGLVSALLVRPPAARLLYVLAHGAGAGMRHPFLEAIARCLAERGIAPGDRFEVVDKQPFDGPLFVRFTGEVEVLGGDLARAMRVRLGPET